MALGPLLGDAELWALAPYNTGIQALEANHLEVAERKLILAHAYVPGIQK